MVALSLLFLSWPIYRYSPYPLIPLVCIPLVKRSFLASLGWCHPTCCSPCSPLFRLANPTMASNPHLPRGTVDPFRYFLVDRFHSVPVPMYVFLPALFLKPLEARTLSLH
ncbi:unnamed protein product [Protopolystoma xenopodis]|uniref:Uncharacterized protein n=1 Tax=Protopolystoma xenopodis TaxID=117903 RepID=A0A3S5APP3_9PLAT|nr:unnamed protein product [Protopolystoma xenopodis]